MTKGFMSWSGMLSMDPFGRTGKLASLWFDELVIEVPRITELVDAIDYQDIRGNPLSTATRKELAKIWKPIQHVLPDYEMRTNWEDVENTDLKHQVHEAVTSEFYAEHPEASRPSYEFPDPYVELEIAKLSTGLMSAVAAWARIESLGAHAFVSHPWERRFISRTLSDCPTSEYDSFCRAIQWRVPDLERMDWDRVLELRNHKFLCAFRSKLRELHEQVRAGDGESIGELLHELEHRDLVEIARLSRPSVGLAVVKGAASNIPFLPINPISVALAYKDITREKYKRDTLGWVYFLIDVDASVKNVEDQ